MSTTKQLLHSARAGHYVLRAYACADPNGYRVEIEDERTGQLRAQDFGTRKAAQIYLRAMHTQYSARPVGTDYIPPPPPPPPKPLIPPGGTEVAVLNLRDRAQIKITYYPATEHRQQWWAVTYTRPNCKPQKFEHHSWLGAANRLKQLMVAHYAKGNP